MRAPVRVQAEGPRVEPGVTVARTPELAPVRARPSIAPVAPGSLSILALRAGGVPEADGLPCAMAYCSAALAEIRRIKAADPGRRCVVFFDLDNTLFETRARTLHVLRLWDEAHGTSHFAALDLADVGWDGKATCEALGLSAIADDVQTFWDDAFWSGAHFDRDLVMTDLAKLACEAERAGAEVHYLTGRIEALRGPSRGQIERAGLPLASDRHLHLKPDLDTRTSPFKAEVLHATMASGTFVGWFATDSVREVDELRAEEAAKGRGTNVPALFVAHALQQGRLPEDATAVFATEHTESTRPQRA